jgi:hypothetical protein
MTGQTVFSAGFGGSWVRVANRVKQMGSIIFGLLLKYRCAAIKKLYHFLLQRQLQNPVYVCALHFAVHGKAASGFILAQSTNSVDLQMSYFIPFPIDNVMNGRHKPSWYHNLHLVPRKSKIGNGIRAVPF